MNCLYLAIFPVTLNMENRYCSFPMKFSGCFPVEANGIAVVAAMTLGIHIMLVLEVCPIYVFSQRNSAGELAPMV